MGRNDVKNFHIIIGVYLAWLSQKISGFSQKRHF